MCHFKTITSQLNLLRYYFIFENIVSVLFKAAQIFRVSSIFDLYFLSQLSQFLRKNQVLERVGTEFQKKILQNHIQKLIFSKQQMSSSTILPNLKNIKNKLLG
jgi:hypothetical protein